jgi:hypothetical protein
VSKLFVEIDAYLCGRAVAVTLDDPVLVIEAPGVDQRHSQFLDRVEVSYPEQVLLPCADESLGTSVALRHEGRRVLDPQKAEFSLEIIGHLVGAVVGPKLEPQGDLRPVLTETLSYPGRIGSIASNRSWRLAA